MMSTSHLSAACSFESLYHILELFVNDKDGNQILQPTLVEREVYRLLRDVNVLPKDDINNAKCQAQHLGEYVNGQLSQEMEVVAYFGKQSIVENQLKNDGLWPRLVYKYLDSKDEGVYAISVAGGNGTIRIVVFAWLSDASFRQDYLRDRATYVLRFLTSFTSHVVYCLTGKDFDNLRATSVCDSLTSKKHSMSFSIEIIEEKLECIVDQNYNWNSRSRNGRLIPGSYLSFYTMKIDRSIRTYFRNFPREIGFAKWLITLSSTHTIEISCMIPESWMIELLKSKDAYPHEYIDSITPESIEDSIYDDFVNETHAKLAEFTKNYKELAKHSFYLMPMTYEHETQAKIEMGECILELEEWKSSYAVGMAPFLIHIQDVVNDKIQEAYSKHPLNQSTSETVRLVRPYLKHENQTMINEIMNGLQDELRTMYEKWCNLLDKVCNDYSNLQTKMTSEVFKKRLESIRIAELVETRKEEAIRDAFSTLVKTMNDSNQHSFVAKIDKYDKRKGISCSQESSEEKSMILIMYEWTNDVRADRGYFKLPAQAKVMYITRVVDLSIVVFTDESHGHITTTIHVYKKPSETPQFIKHFQQQILLVDFDCRHRLLGLVDSNDVKYYKFHETYMGLERVGTTKLSVLQISCRYTHMFLFGGDTHGMILIDQNCYLQSCIIRSKRLSKLEMDPIGITKVVKIYGGDLFLFLTMEADDQMSKEYSVLVKCMSTADNSMLPMTRITIPKTISWMDCMFECYQDLFVCFDPINSLARTWTLHIVTGKTGWQLHHVARSLDSGLEYHPLWCLFYLFEKFPVQSLIAKTAKEDPSLVSGQLFLHVLGSTHKARVVAVLDLVMKKLSSLNKCISPLNLLQDLTVHSSNVMPWIASTVTLTKWIMELIAFIPVQICRPRDNQLVLLQNSKVGESPQGSAAHEVAKSIWFGPVSCILQRWSGSVVVLTSMGKRSTDKCYYLNHLTGSSFAFSSTRCTDGVWLTFRVLSPTSLLVVLNFEGLGSFERSAQEDIFLSVLNAAISRLTIFGIDMRFATEIESNFSKFQQGVSLLKGDPRLFQGKLYLHVTNDVNPNDQHDVIYEIKTKLETILNENGRENFVTIMYSGQIEVACSPRIGNVGYYEALHEGLELLKNAAQRTTYANGIDFYDCFTMVLSKISLLDWTCMGNNVKASQVTEFHENFENALRYGQLLHGSFVDGEVDIYTEKWKELVGDEVDYKALSDDASIDLQVDLQANNDKAITGVHKILMSFLTKFLEWINMPRNASTEQKFDSVWTYILWRREHRIRLWIASMSFLGREEMDHVDSKFFRLKRLLRRCQHTCAECKLGCFESLLHETASSPHDCGTNHICLGKCTHCAILLENDVCTNVAGHTGSCNCGTRDNLCMEPCALVSAPNCERFCSREVGHLSSHSCSVSSHYCGQPCEATSCHGICSLPLEPPHDEHTCGANCCQQPCIMKDCWNTCANLNHFHAKDAEHFCGQTHLCRCDCNEMGVCDIKIHSEKAIESFKGKCGTVEFRRQEMNGEKKKCNEIIDSLSIDHAGSHRCNSKIHYCDVRCPFCQYFCGKPFGHFDLHGTSHGNMKYNYCMSDTVTVDVQDPIYADGEQMCPFLCSKMGRGHVHFMPCEQTVTSCAYTASDGRKHSRLMLQHHLKQPMDEVLHDTYWKTLGWEDPVTSSVERRMFKLCPYQCDVAGHPADSPSYCILDAWHDVVDRTDSRGLQQNHSIVQGHLFACRHTTGQELSHRTVVLDASGSILGYQLCSDS